jgi:PIN domain nuclease of toxin-antitoxin system
MILLDTHAIVWLLAVEGRLSDKVRSAILEARVRGESLAYSPVSVYEISYASRRGRLPLATPTEDFISAVEAALELAPLTTEIALRAAQLPEPFHGDPVDRIIAATAIVNQCTLITHDDRIRKANVCKVLW